MSKRLPIWASTHVGRLRTTNQDRCRTPEWLATGANEEWRGTAERVGGWIVIADGMGGHGAGETASEVAVQSMARLLPLARTQEHLVEAIQTANYHVHEAMTADGGLPGMGTTIVGALLQGDFCTFFNVGDSRAYLLHGPLLTMHSLDHTLDVDRSSGMRSHTLTQSLGGTLTMRRLSPNIEQVAITPGDIILLCSDGLTDLVKEDKIAMLLRSKSTHPATALVDAALAAGGRDNVTVAVLAP